MPGFFGVVVMLAFHSIVLPQIYIVQGNVQIRGKALKTSVQEEKNPAVIDAAYRTIAVSRG